MKKSVCRVGIIFGFIIMLLGFAVLGQNPGANVMRSTSFGADFYTYSYKATQEAAENVYYLTKIVRMGISFLLIAIGMTDICAFGVALSNDSKEKEIAENEKNDINNEELPPL